MPVELGSRLLFLAIVILFFCFQQPDLCCLACSLRASEEELPQVRLQYGGWQYTFEVELQKDNLSKPRKNEHFF